MGWAMVVGEDWRAWIVENLILGNSSDSMISTMVSKGVPVASAVLEIEAAKRGPYFRGSKMAMDRTQTRLKKYSWFFRDSAQFESPKRQGSKG